MSERLAELEGAVRKLTGGVVVAFSGGVDSALLLKVCVDQLGDRVLAVTADSASLPDHDRRDALELARTLGVRHLMVATGELEDPRYRKNDRDRCYFCKQALFDVLRRIADEQGLPNLVFGANLDDDGDFRPGHRAAAEAFVLAPLQEIGLSKNEVRELALELGLSVWDKPASACLASRIPHGTEVRAELLDRVQAAEAFLRERGYRQCRVRDHGDTARLELLAEDLGRAVGEDRQPITERLTRLGYRFVSVDLAGYRSGSLNPTGASDGSALEDRQVLKR